ncbi:NUDIX hydrolase [Candidatus Woesearchaeota archaeon]|nr:NUDIX hydrolase [Candidatus Woesearchaeota archaeon]
MLIAEWEDPNDGRVRFTFFEPNTFEDFTPIAQSYGLCFGADGKLVIGRCEGVHRHNWILPGGRVEPDEHPLQTLHREVDEELSITLKTVGFIGVQKVEYLDIDKEPVYQLRFAAIIDEVKQLTPDPDTGKLWERRFIDPESFLEYLPWGAIGKRLVHLAKSFFEKND